MKVQEATDGIGVDVDERDWVPRPFAALEAPHARLMDEQLVNRYKRYGNLGSPQSRQIPATGRAEAAYNSNWAIEIDAAEIDAAVGARGYHHLACFKPG
jgi:hypothetical protein